MNTKTHFHSFRVVMITMVLAFITLVPVLAQQGGRRGNGGGDENIDSIVAQIPASELDSGEIAGLLLMREEEKLARDVYTALYEIWKMNVFQNIAASEQSHMESIGYLLERYDLDDPVGTDIPGEFENQELQQLYDRLVEQGSESLRDAFTVGATVEDLDIKDLAELRHETDNEDIQVVYQNLEKGSRNHLRSFVSQLERNGGSYSAVYISDEYYKAILGSPRETGGAVTDPEFQFGG